jgi:hypothetical protein
MEWKYGQSEVLGRNLSQCSSVHHKSHWPMCNRWTGRVVWSPLTGREQEAKKIGWTMNIKKNFMCRIHFNFLRQIKQYSTNDCNYLKK